MMMSEEQSLFLGDVAKLIQFILSLGYIVTGGELWRSDFEAWVNSLPAHSILKAETPQGSEAHYHDAVGGYGIQHSLHLKKLAIDLNVIKDGKLIEDVPTLTPIGNYWQGLNLYNRAGMFFVHPHPDTDHYERNVP